MRVQTRINYFVPAELGPSKRKLVDISGRNGRREEVNANEEQEEEEEEAKEYVPRKSSEAARSSINSR
jgi:hypothetical protein